MFNIASFFLSMYMSVFSLPCEDGNHEWYYAGNLTRAIFVASRIEAFNKELCLVDLHVNEGDLFKPFWFQVLTAQTASEKNMEANLKDGVEQVHLTDQYL